MSDEANRAIKFRYDSEKFIEGVVRDFGAPNLSQEQGFLFLLSKLQDSAKITRTDAQGYALSTIWWETDQTMQPITEKDNKSKTYLRGKPYWPWIGKGYVMLTWEDNYRKFGKALGIDLIAEPTKVNEPETAWLILEEGMTNMDLGFKDPEFTKYTLEQFFNETTQDFYNARKIINPGDKKTYQIIADNAEKFYKILEEAKL